MVELGTNVFSGAVRLYQHINCRDVGMFIGARYVRYFMFSLSRSLVSVTKQGNHSIIQICLWKKM